MKSFVKWFGIIAFAAVIGFSTVGCNLDFNDYDLLNGTWDRTGQYVVTFNDGKGVFKELYGSFWLPAKTAGKIKIGDQCYRNLVKSGDKKWTGEIRLYYNTSPYETAWWESCTITLNADGQAIQITYSSITFTCTKM
jgi:hypothetical protein